MLRKGDPPLKFAVVDIFAVPTHNFGRQHMLVLCLLNLNEYTMRKSMMLIVMVAVAACRTAPELEREQAVKLISQARGFPASYGYTIFLDDPEHMDRLRGSALENEGLVTVVPLGESKQPSAHFITLAEKAKTYIMDDRLPTGQVRVRVATAYLEPDGKSTTFSASGNDGTVQASYRIYYRDITPFAQLLGRQLPPYETSKAYFRYDNGKWNIVDLNK